MWLAAIVIGCCALAADGTGPDPVAAAAVIAETDRLNGPEFDGHTRLARDHPNELWRLYGAESASQGDWADAIASFQRAARHADKYSQHRLSLIYWHGVGAERDPVRAYVWADLAAERMYPQFLLLREKMWLALDEPERARALEQGQAMYAEYGDLVAKPRFERAIAKARREITGSRTGFVGNLAVYAPSMGDGLFGGSSRVDLSDRYDDRRWDPDAYWAVEDVIWQKGNVDVGPLEQVGDAL